jgi:Spy/CpxP family protein refolding chaperone
MKYPISLIAGLALLPIFQAQAQRTPPTPEEMAQHEVSRYTTLLSLNSQQAADATSIFTAAATTESTLRTNERTTHQTLQAAIKTDDAAAIQQAATSLGQINGEMTAARALAQAKFYATLTSDQKTKFDELDRGFHGEHGRPAGPPPAP